MNYCRDLDRVIYLESGFGLSLPPIKKIFERTPGLIYFIKAEPKELIKNKNIVTISIPQ